MSSISRFSSICICTQQNSQVKARTSRHVTSHARQPIYPMPHRAAYTQAYTQGRCNASLDTACWLHACRHSTLDTRADTPVTSHACRHYCPHAALHHAALHPIRAPAIRRRLYRYICISRHGMACVMRQATLPAMSQAIRRASRCCVS